MAKLMTFALKERSPKVGICRVTGVFTNKWNKHEFVRNNLMITLSAIPCRISIAQHSGK